MADSIGYGAYLKGYRFAGFWAPSQKQQSIAYKELFPVVLAAHIWGHQLPLRPWCCSPHPKHQDIKTPRLMRLLHSLLLLATRHSFSFSTQHVPDVNNQIADALSRFLSRGFGVGAGCPATSHPRTPRTPSRINVSALERCYSFLNQGLSPSKRR